MSRKNPSNKLEDDSTVWRGRTALYKALAAIGGAAVVGLSVGGLWLWPSADPVNPREVSAMGTDNWPAIRAWIDENAPGFALFGIVGYEGLRGEAFGVAIDGGPDPSRGNGRTVVWGYLFSKDTALILILYSTIKGLSVTRGTLTEDVVPISQWVIDSDDAIAQASAATEYLARNPRSTVSYVLAADIVRDPKSTLWIISMKAPSAPFFQVVVDAVSGEVIS